MSEFSVGDWVLVSAQISEVNSNAATYDVTYESGEHGWHDSVDLRPDTGGRDLTAQDARDAFICTAGGDGRWRHVADWLNRIARGDAGSAGDDTAPPAKPDQVLAFQYGGGRNGKARCPCGHVGMSHGENEEAARAGGKDPCRLCPCIGFRTFVSNPAAAAGPRAGDTAPDDEEMQR